MTNIFQNMHDSNERCETSEHAFVDMVQKESGIYEYFRPLVG